MEIIPFINNASFNGFASLIFWLMVISVPFYMIVGFIASLRKTFEK